MAVGLHAHQSALWPVGIGPQAYFNVLHHAGLPVGLTQPPSALQGRKERIVVPAPTSIVCLPAPGGSSRIATASILKPAAASLFANSLSLRGTDSPTTSCTSMATQPASWKPRRPAF